MKYNNIIVIFVIVRISKTVERLRRKTIRACKMVASCNVFRSIGIDRNGQFRCFLFGGRFMDSFMTIKETAALWNLTERRVQKMCADGLIEGVQRFGNSWAIPKEAKRPLDGRVTTGEYINWRKKREKNVGK